VGRIPLRMRGRGLEKSAIPWVGGASPDLPQAPPLTEQARVAHLLILTQGSAYTKQSRNDLSIRRDHPDSTPVPEGPLMQVGPVFLKDLKNSEACCYIVSV
jgi:hypothetical protein